jgi:excisionase family DNA binding protein
MTTHTTQPPRVLLTAEEAATRLNIGRTTMFALLKSGVIDSVKVGRLRRVPETALSEYAERATAGNDNASTEGN